MRSLFLIRVQKDSVTTEMGKVDDWNFKSADGVLPFTDATTCHHPSTHQKNIRSWYTITAVLLLPTRAFEGNYPLNLYAAMGYVVYTLQPSGTTGFGQEFSARHVNAWGDKTADDIIQGTKLFCRSHDFADSTRLGCFGASYGGFMTMYLQTKTDIFKAAVSHAGISNIASYWGEGYWGYSYSSVASAGSYPLEQSAACTPITARSFHADKDQDSIVAFTGSSRHQCSSSEKPSKCTPR